MFVDVFIESRSRACNELGVSRNQGKSGHIQEHHNVIRLDLHSISLRAPAGQSFPARPSSFSELDFSMHQVDDWGGQYCRGRLTDKESHSEPAGDGVSLLLSE